MADTLRRVAVHAPDPHAPVTVDLVLPAGCPVGELLPGIVDTVVGDTPPTEPLQWCLTRVGGPPVDTSKTLFQNAVGNGDLVLLTSAGVPAAQRTAGASPAVVTKSCSGSAGSGPDVVAAAGIGASVVLAGALGWAGCAGKTDSALWVAAALSAAAAVGAATGRSPRPLAVALGGCDGVRGRDRCARAGGAPWDAVLLQAAAAGLGMSLVLCRIASRAVPMLAGYAAGAGAVAAAALVCVLAGLGPAGAGAVLTVASLAALSAAPVITIAATGLGPGRGTVGAHRAVVAHGVLTGLTTGWACSAALGVVGVVADPQVARGGAGAFAAVAGSLLVLRQRVHVVPIRRIALGTAGSGALVAALAALVAAPPAGAAWLCAALAVVGAAALRYWARGAPLNPILRSGVALVEYVSLAAVVPLAVWMTGLYGSSAN